jgi:hypothetical protein
MAPLAPLPEPTLTRREAFAALKAGLDGACRPPTLDEMVPSFVPALDRLLGGGFPRGTLVTLEGSAGRWSIAARLIAYVTQRAMAAIVDDGNLYPPGLLRAGVRLERLLIVPARTPLGTARAADVLLRSRTCRLVVMTAPHLRAAVWMRLAGLAKRGGVLLIVIVSRAAAALGGAAELRLRCSRERLVVAGTRGLWCTFAGYGVRAELHKHRRFAAGGHAAVRAVDSLDGAVLRERAVVLREVPMHAAVR